MFFIPDFWMWVSRFTGGVTFNRCLADTQVFMTFALLFFAVYHQALGKPWEDIIVNTFENGGDENHDIAKDAFGTNVPAHFPDAYAYVMVTLGVYPFLILSQVFFWFWYAFRIILGSSPSAAIKIVKQEWTSGYWAMMFRYSYVAVIFAVGAFTYLIAPILSFMFLLYFCFGGMAYRYLMFYMDFYLTDSGGLFWEQLRCIIPIIICLLQLTTYAMFSSMDFLGEGTRRTLFIVVIIVTIFWTLFIQYRWKLLDKKILRPHAVKQRSSMVEPSRCGVKSRRNSMSMVEPVRRDVKSRRNSMNMVEPARCDVEKQRNSLVEPLLRCDVRTLLRFEHNPYIQPHLVQGRPTETADQTLARRSCRVSV